jgi:hypothetical protein
MIGSALARPRSPEGDHKNAALISNHEAISKQRSGKNRFQKGYMCLDKALKNSHPIPSH